jgi:hypothetical protein
MITTDVSDTTESFTRYSISFSSGGSLKYAEIHEIYMEDWTLFECFLLPGHLLGYLSWDNDAAAPEWIELEAGISEADADALIAAIIDRRNPPRSSTN